MKSKRTLRMVTATSVLLASTVGLGAVFVNEQGIAVLAEIARDPLAAFGQRSPGQRRAGALFQTKPSKVAPQAVAAAPPAAPPPVVQPVANPGCELLATPVSTAAAPVSPEVERLAGQLVAGVQQALAANKTADQAQREGAVEQAIQGVLENSDATPQVAMPALGLAQTRLVAMGLNCGPGVPEAMETALVATQAALPGDIQTGAINQPGQSVLGSPPPTGGGGRGGGTTHPPVPNAV